MKKYAKPSLKELGPLRMVTKFSIGCTTDGNAVTDAVCKL